MRIKGIGRVFIFCIILFIALFSARNILITRSGALKKIISRFTHTSTASAPKQKTSNRIEANITALLHELEVKDEEIKTRTADQNKSVEIRAAVPRGRPDEWVVWKLCQSAKGTPYALTDCYFTKKEGQHTLTFESEDPKKNSVRLIISKATRCMSNCGVMAILVEDFNFEANQATVDFLSFPEPLTFSLVPYLKKSSWTAQAAKEYKKEIVIHLPFESKFKKKSVVASETIMVHYSEERIRGLIKNAIRIIPNFSGFTNLDGSLALEDSRVMSIVLDEIHKHNGYFIDTRAAKNSIIPAIAGKLRLPFEEASEAITENSNATALEHQLKRSILLAQKQGAILITVKASRHLITALKNLLPVLKENGVRLVYVSDIVNQQYLNVRAQ